MHAVSGFLFGFGLALAFGIVHHFALSGILKIAPHHARNGKSVVVVTFAALLTVHTAEIVGLAGLNQWIAGA